MTIFIAKDLKRINISAPYVDSEGRQYGNLHDRAFRAALGITEVQEPQAPEDYTPEGYFITESDFPPYVVYNKKTPEQLTQLNLPRYESQLDSFLDSVAAKYRFASRGALTGRAGYPNKWQDLAVAYGTWMDNCNVLAYEYLERYLAGTSPFVTVEEFLAMLPEFTYSLADGEV